MTCIVYKLYISAAKTAHMRGRRDYDDSQTIVHNAE